MPNPMTPEELRLTVVIEPLHLPVTQDEVRAALRIDSDDADDDSILMAMAKAATEYCESQLAVSLITRTFDLFLDHWPSKRKEKWWDGVRTGAISELFATERELHIPRPPLQSITHIKTYDDDDVASTFAATKYFVDTATKPGRVVLRIAAETPAPTRVANGLEIRCVAGYGDDYADVPEDVRQGIFRMAAHMFEHRGECPIEESADASGASALWGYKRVMRL